MYMYHKKPYIVYVIINCCADAKAGLRLCCLHTAKSGFLESMVPESQATEKHCVYTLSFVRLCEKKTLYDDSVSHHILNLYACP